MSTDDGLENLFCHPTFEQANHSRMYAGAYKSLNAFNHTRSLRSKWRFPLGGLLCVILPVMVLAWGTAYKLSLYNTSKTGAPAKVCTRGSDAAQSSVSHAIDGHKAAGNGTAASLPPRLLLVFSDRENVTLANSFLFILPLQLGSALSARPPPVGFLFA